MTMTNQDGGYDLSHTKLTPDRLKVLDELSTKCSSLEGDFAECGVWQGGSAKVLLKGKILRLFDTFNGMPEHGEKVDSTGSFSNTSVQMVKDYLNSLLVKFHEGKIPQSFRGLEYKQYCFVHIDVDLYQSTKDCLEYFLPRMVKGGMIVCDDYGFPDYKDAAKKAVDEMITMKLLETNQGVYEHTI